MRIGRTIQPTSINIKRTLDPTKQTTITAAYNASGPPGTPRPTPTPMPQLQYRLNAELNRLIERSLTLENTFTVTASNRTIAHPVSDKNIPSKNGSLYNLVNDAHLCITNGMTAAGFAGFDWNSLSEGQKIYLYNVLQNSQSTNVASTSDIPSTILTGLSLGKTTATITYNSFYDVVNSDPVGVASAIDEIEHNDIHFNELSDAQKNYIVLTNIYGLPAKQPTIPTTE